MSEYVGGAVTLSGGKCFEPRFQLEWNHLICG